MSTGKGIHSGHRRRMKERFLANGLDGFSDHEVLELALFYAIPRVDVNELSHRLIECFGSYRAVFDADYNDILAVEGMGESAATMIKLMSAMWRRYALSENSPEFVFDNLKKVGEYAVKLYIGVDVEKLYAMLFDNRMKLIDTVMLAEGAVNSVRTSARFITEKAIKKNASSVILIHNHPNGTPYPSEEDRNFSQYLKDLFDNLDIVLIDHIIVSGRFYRPIFEEKLGENKFASPKRFAYGASTLSGIRTSELIAASDVPFDKE